MCVKVVKSDDEKQKRETSSEANLIIGLLHPNVIRLFGVTRTKNKIGIVMEKAAHGSLDQWLGRIAGERLPNVALGIVKGLEYVHSQCVIHRDIRPLTILMCGSEKNMIPKIGDFSTSKVIQQATIGTVVGADFYNAPEVNMMLPYGFSSDVFSLAITLFELFNGQLVEKAPIDVKRMIFDVKAGRVGKIPSTCKVPECLRDVIERGWYMKPEDRPALSEYKSVLGKMIKKPEVKARDISEKRISKLQQVNDLSFPILCFSITVLSF